MLKQCWFLEVTANIYIKVNLNVYQCISICFMWWIFNQMGVHFEHCSNILIQTFWFLGSRSLFPLYFSLSLHASPPPPGWSDCISLLTCHGSANEVTPVCQTILCMWFGKLVFWQRWSDLQLGNLHDTLFFCPSRSVWKRLIYSVCTWIFFKVVFRQSKYMYFCLKWLSVSLLPFLCLFSVGEKIKKTFFFLPVNQGFHNYWHL